MEFLESCLVCGCPSRGARIVHHRRDDALVRCPRCALVFANPQYTPAELDELYRTIYYDERQTMESTFREEDYRATRPLYETVLRDILRRYPRLGRGARVLDYGCGVGFFLVACKNAGLQPRGVDFSSTAMRYARERFGLDVSDDPDASLRAMPDGSFDLVTAWQVIEHVRRPRETLVELVRVLAPGGVLCVAVPHLRALRYRIERARWFNIQNLTHLSFFNQRNLGGLLAGLGLVNLVRPVFWGGRGGFGPVKNTAQYLVRLLNVGNELRLYAEKPAISR